MFGFAFFGLGFLRNDSLSPCVRCRCKLGTNSPPSVFPFHPRQIAVKCVSIEQCLWIKGSLNYLTRTFCSTSLSHPLPHWALWELRVQTFKFGVEDVLRSHLLSPWETRASSDRGTDESRRRRENQRLENGCQGPDQLMAFAELSPSTSMSSPLANSVPMC